MKQEGLNDGCVCVCVSKENCTQMVCLHQPEQVTKRTVFADFTIMTQDCCQYAAYHQKKVGMYSALHDLSTNPPGVFQFFDFF
jgi:hypothetical protein